MNDPLIAGFSVRCDSLRGEVNNTAKTLRFASDRIFIFSRCCRLSQYQLPQKRHKIWREHLANSTMFISSRPVNSRGGLTPPLVSQALAASLLPPPLEQLPGRNGLYPDGRRETCPDTSGLEHSTFARRTWATIPLHVIHSVTHIRPPKQGYHGGQSTWPFFRCGRARARIQNHLPRQTPGGSPKHH